MLAPWKKFYDKPQQHTKKERHHFADNSAYSQSYGLSSSHGRMWELDHKEDWVSKNWELWCWRRLLRVPGLQGDQPILKQIYPEYSLEGLMLKLKLQYFGHLMRKANSLEKTLMLGKIEGKRRRGRQIVRWLDNITDSTDMNFSKLQEIVRDRGTWRAIVQGVTESQTRLNWTTMCVHTCVCVCVCSYSTHMHPVDSISLGKYLSFRVIC